MGSRGFVLLTENYSYLWFWLAFRPFLGAGTSLPGPRAILLSALFLTLAALTRQNWLWLCPWMVMALTAPRLAASPAPTFGAAARTAWPYAIPLLACLPIFLYWQGLVPRNWQGVNQASGVNLKAVVFTFALLGLYASLLAPSRLIACLSPLRVAVALGAGALLGLAGQLHHASLFWDSGFIWFVSDFFPTFAGANTLLAALVALGLLELARAAREKQWRYLAYVLLFALSFASVRMTFQKYYEIPLLAGVILSSLGYRFRILDRLGQAAWVAAGVAYLLSKIGRLEAPLLGG